MWRRTLSLFWRLLMSGGQIKCIDLYILLHIFLNPQFQYNPSSETNSADIKIGLYSCLQRMVPDPNERLLIDLQMDAFKNAKGLFRLETAVMSRTKKAPADWWDSYGDECPELKRFAIRILSLTCSSSGCERN